MGEGQAMTPTPPLEPVPNRHATASDALRNAIREFVAPDNSFKGRRVKFIFAWYDLWVGLFWDTEQKYVYFFPIPMFGVRYYYGY